MTWRDRLLGGEDRLGWWLVPFFLVVGLAGAVLAGSLAVVYYGQQVDELRRETAESREAIAGAADEVRGVADEALEAIAEEAAAIAEAQALPLEDVDERGLVRLEVDTEVTVQGATAADPRPAPDPDDDGEDGDDEPTVEEGEEPAGTDEPDEAPAPPSGERVRVARSSVGFVVVRDGDHDYVVTTFSLLADPRRPDVPLDVPVTVRAPGGDTSAEIHSWDEERDLLLLRTRLGAIEPLEWRPADDGVGTGDRIVAIGLTPRLEVVRLGATLGSVDGSTWVSDLPALTALEGGPVVDGQGRVVGVRSPAAAGLGGDPAVVPVRVLCERLLRSCPP
jgi:S1-C subfamily serine protease